ncbi:hypothetical protein A3C23_04435 [Candidatus Roizmanbacteria bacterium RIFCSPHIGHO2_02_FULL_37_13b]|uniref:Uncharacterized protein n=1 Tax=Candidatus Roizmanbacteria bacterium RIFCSPLOWO2_02_FULL_36_11 TaxID=1802071 RepID=A0A1F7JH95_9BACT|nr:MAG: hypothetical protein A3C23_04435 [Candidatus Roizmanbacteria bacterium RIFCSPHIGHO2_02_FULL_37_13b]OGK54956.1 MAG: hypothetical protein A3H78_00580 [Candidatus Roizmanbacteria bacterium RIFCSPLOWO2_02_FULL_36_11]
MSRQDTKELFLAFALSLTTLFCIANIYLTQDLSPLLFAVSYDARQDAAIMLLRLLNKQSIYKEQLTLFKSIHGEKIEEKVTAEQNLRHQKINQLLSLLKKNPFARDVLLNLAYIYYQDGNISSSNHYYNLAKQVDPLLFHKDLEDLH